MVKIKIMLLKEIYVECMGERLQRDQLYRPGQGWWDGKGARTATLSHHSANEAPQWDLTGEKRRRRKESAG